MRSIPMVVRVINEKYTYGIVRVKNEKYTYGSKSDK